LESGLTHHWHDALPNTGRAPSQGCIDTKEEGGVIFDILIQELSNPEGLLLAAKEIPRDKKPDRQRVDTCLYNFYSFFLIK
jgi:hypothetical protein